MCVAHYIYLGEEIEAAQAADNAVDLGEPSAFTTGLWRKRQIQNTGVSQDCSSKYNHRIRPVEQSKAFFAETLKLHSGGKKIHNFSNQIQEIWNN